MALTLFYAGSDYTSYLATRSLSIQDRLDSRNTASLTLVDPATGTPSAPAIGAAVQIGDKVDSTTNLAEDVDSGAETDVDVGDSSVFAVGDYVLVDTEVWKITAISSPTLTVQRGAMGSTKATHSNGADVFDFTPYFAGSVDTITTTPAARDTVISYRLTLVDWNQILDRFLLLNNFTTTDQTSGDIVKSIVNDTGMFPQARTTDTLNGLEGVTAALTTDSPAGSVEPGVKVVSYLFNYATVSDAFQQLADLTGYYFNVNYNKEVEFRQDLGTAATTITEANKGDYLLAGTITKASTRDQFRNQQFLRGGAALSPSTTVDYNTNITKAYKDQIVLHGPVGADLSASDVQVKPSGGSYANISGGVGIKNVDISKGAYYQIGSNLLEIDASISDDDIIRVIYQYQIPMMTQSSNEESIAARATAEGNSGLYATIETTPDININSGFDRGRASVERFGTIPQTITYQSDTLTWTSGSTQTITLTSLDVTALACTITSREIKDVDGVHLRATYTLEDSLHRRDWVDWFTKIKRQNDLKTYNQNEILTYARPYTETTTEAKPW